MAKTVKIRDTVYSDVPSVQIPLSPGPGNASFYDISAATISSNGQSLSGVKSYGADGTLYTGNIVTKTGTDLSASGDTVTVPAGYYASQATKAITGGQAIPPQSISGTSASISSSSGSITLSKTVSATPAVLAGYISTGTAGNVDVSLTASVTTKGATTYAPSTSAQSIASGTYLTGTQTIPAVTTTNLSASNIVAGVTVKVGYSGDDDSVASVAGSAQVPSISQDSTTKILSIS